MDLNGAIAGRRAVREYTAQAVDEKSIRALINAAIQAPSAVNQHAGACASQYRSSGPCRCGEGTR